jgi:hypothetical protein
VSELTHPAAVLERLAGIEQDLGTRQNDFEQAASDRARCVRDWEKRLAIHSKTAKGSSADIRKAVALVTAIEQDDLYERLTDAEARYDALRVVTNVLTARATIGQSILKAQGRT